MDKYAARCVAKRSRLDESTSFDTLYLFQDVPKQIEPIKIFRVARGARRRISAESHLSRNFVLQSPRALDRISLHRLSSSVCLKASRSALWLTSFFRVNFPARTPRRISAESALFAVPRALDCTSLHGLSSSGHLKASRSSLRLTVFSCKLALFDSAQGSRGTVYTKKLLATASFEKPSDGQRSSNHVDFCSQARELQQC